MELSNYEKVIHEIDSVLCKTFHKEYGYYRRKILESPVKFDLCLEGKVDADIGSRLSENAVLGMRIVPIYERCYPFGKLASTIIGCVGAEGRGLEGIELQYNDILAGEPSQKFVFTDGSGKQYLMLCDTENEPRPGNDIYLTIDIRIQEMLECELENAMELYNANSACGVFLDHRTGEILAIGSIPNYDPNEQSKYTPERRRNRAITDPYEPGSIFKLVTMAMALEEGIISTTDTFDCENGEYSVCGRILKDVHGIGKVPASEIIVQSSNIGIVKIAQLAEKQVLYDYIKRFGFGSISGIDFPGECSGSLKSPENWWLTTLATIPMGYEISATPLQIACAFGAIANDGIYMRPYIAYKCENQYREMRLLHEPVAVRRVVSKEVADTLKSLLQSVVVRGTAQQARSSLIDFAGKTGTSRKQKTGTRGYFSESYYSSFGGFAPCDKPLISGMILIDDPRGKYYGGSVAAPVFARVMEKVFSANILNHPYGTKFRPIATASSPENVVVPDICGSTPEQAKEILHARKISVEFEGEGSLIVNQSPEPGRIVEQGDVVIAYLQDYPKTNSDSIIVVPDVVNMPLRDAIVRLSRAGINFRIEGSGIVVAQSPRKDCAISREDVCVLLCKAKGKK